MYEIDLSILDQDGAPTHTPSKLLTAAAVRAGSIRNGDPLGQNLVDYALDVVTIAACIADCYRHPACPEDTVGNEIRARVD
ncbi:hypothetical protein ACSFA3_20900 [Variovorax sp. RHLX14]|uniref:hypothetical protein n=1 Tax=Variovorax sp. RHLX14 TaxID=1259731 RepID=UPI003F487560